VLYMGREDSGIVASQSTGFFKRPPPVSGFTMNGGFAPNEIYCDATCYSIPASQIGNEGSRADKKNHLVYYIKQKVF